MTFNKGDVVYYVGESIARQRAAIHFPGTWGPIGCANGSIGIIESINRDSLDGGIRIERCYVRFTYIYLGNIPIFVTHVTQPMYDFELDLLQSYSS